MNDVATQKVKECFDENLFEPNRQWPETIFEERSYARWAALEIWEMLLDHPHDDPDTIIELFAMKMELYAYMTDNPVRSRIFRIAKETAEDILTLV